MENDTTFLYSIVGKEKILSIKTVFQLMTWTKYLVILPVKNIDRT
jgi:hypothetical protein